MRNAVLVRGARQLLTLRGPGGPRRGSALNRLGIIEDGAVLIVDGVIRHVGPTRQVENLELARRAEEIDAHGRVVMPGFVDSHTHLVSGAPSFEVFERSLVGPAASSEFDEKVILPGIRYVRATPARKLRSEAASIVRGCLRHGTTTLEAKSGYGLDEGVELKIFRVMTSLRELPPDIVPTFFSGTFIPPELEHSPDAYVDWLCERMLPIVHRRKFAVFVDAACERGALTVKQARRFLETARHLGFPIKVDAGQFVHRGGVDLAVELGAVSVDHLAITDHHDVELLAESSIIATLLPGSVFHAGHRQYPPARELLDRGAAVALATNFSRGTTPCYNMQMILSLACRQMRMSAAEAISAATINGAHAILRADRAGSLEIGKDADLIVLNVSDYRDAIYEFGSNQVSLTMKRGRIVYNSSEASWSQQDIPGPEKTDD